MNVNTKCKRMLLAVLLPLLMLADVSFEAPATFTLGREAAAIVGAPWTPMSYAGVARRTTRRVVAVETVAVTSAAAATSAAAVHQQQAVAQQQAATAKQQQAVAQQQAATAQQQAQAAGSPAIGTIVAALPAGCVGEAKGGVEYYRCGNVYYRAAFQGNNLVYVVQQP